MVNRRGCSFGEEGSRNDEHGEMIALLHVLYLLYPKFIMKDRKSWSTQLITMWVRVNIYIYITDES